METSIEQQPQWEDLAIRPSDGPTLLPPVKKPEQVPASYLTHELRAPVTAIRLGLEILKEQVDNRLTDDERQMLAMAVKNTSRLEGLVNDIMDYSKLMAGRLTVENKPVDPRLLLGEACDSLRALALAKGVRLVKDDGEWVPRVEGDARRIIQVLTNLISNAIKFTPVRGTVTVSCALGAAEHEGTVVFRVKDTGRGIPAKDIEKVFDMFVQSSNVKASDGTGLGLTLARLMVEAQGGRIWAESWRQLGATFSFTIPLSSADQRRKVQPYRKPVEVSGLLVSIARRVNSFLALFV